MRLILSENFLHIYTPVQLYLTKISVVNILIDCFRKHLLSSTVPTAYYQDYNHLSDIAPLHSLVTAAIE